MHVRGITVHVTDKSGNRLPEWGPQRLRLQNSAEKASAYIQATTGVQFQLSVQPTIPFVEHERFKSEPGGRSQRLRADSDECLLVAGQRSDAPRGKLVHTSPVQVQSTQGKAPDFSFLASLYLDGRSVPERRIIVYTNPADRDFNAPYGKVTFRHRWVSSRDGSMKEHAWIFKEKAIETVFDRLLIAGCESGDEGCNTDGIIEALQSSDFGVEDGDKGQKSKVGQIVVELRRVVLGQKTFDAHYRSKHKEGQDDDVDMNATDTKITHAAGFLYKNTISASPLRVVDYWDYDPDEGLWASFQFFYRSADQLRNFGFKGFQTTPKTTPRTGRALDGFMANLTPLSIMSSRSTNSQISKNHETYEEKVKKRSFKLKKPTYDPAFGDMYRDAAAMSAHENVRTLKSAVAQSAISAARSSQTKKAATQKGGTSVNLPGLHSSEPEIIDLCSPSPSPTRKRSAQRKPNLCNASDSSSPNHPPTKTTKSSAPLESKSFSSVTAEQGSPPPSTASLTAENIYKFNNDLRDNCYPPKTPNSHASDADAERDTDEDLNTESDLETHIEDDDIEYVANPEEDEEGQHNLRARFKSVEIRKRSHAHIEDGDAECEEGIQMNAGMTDGLGSGEGVEMHQKPKSPLLLEEKKDQEHEAKKARTKHTSGQTE